MNSPVTPEICLVRTLRRRGVWFALVGLVVWAVGMITLRPGLDVALLLLGPLVAVPLGLPLTVQRHSLAPAPGLWRLVQTLQLPAACLFLASFAWPPGVVAAALALPWLALTALFVALALMRFVERGSFEILTLGLDAGLVFPVVGGVWAVFSRWGKPLLGFEEPLVLLTAAHFHFAGFALPILTALVGRAGGDGPRQQRLARAATIGGEETFAVEKALDSGRVVLSISSWSQPVCLVPRLLRPLARRLQRTAVLAALRQAAAAQADGVSCNH